MSTRERDGKLKGHAIILEIKPRIGQVQGIFSETQQYMVFGILSCLAYLF
jgi:hypothetical protein